MTDNIVKDKDYDLVSTLYHAAQGLQNTKQYAADAEKEGDTEAAEFFKEVQSKYKDLTEKAKSLAGQRLK